MENLKLHSTIGYYRKRANLTQEALAQKLGVTIQAVSKWESAQCYPDISLIPQLAELFEISIDELFGREPQVNDICSQFPLRDDDIYRVVVARGKRVHLVEDFGKPIEITFPKNCNETTRQYFKVEVFGNLYCDASINGDVLARGNIECNQINGEYIKCIEDSTIHINCNIINSDVRTFGDVRCTQINGDAACFNGGNLICEGNITGNANTFHGGNISCGGSIIGDVSCSNNVECKTIEGSVECQGSIVYK